MTMCFWPNALESLWYYPPNSSLFQCLSALDVQQFITQCLRALCCRGRLHLPVGRKSSWEHQVLQQSGQTICILIIPRALGSYAVNWDAKTNSGEVRKLRQILSLGFLFLMEGGIVLVGLVWGCHSIPVVPVLQACCTNWNEAQDGNASKKGSLCLRDFSVPLKTLVKGKYPLVPFS